MGLLDIARAEGKDLDVRKLAEEDEAKRANVRRLEILDEMKRKFLEGIQELDGQKCSSGTLRVLTKIETYLAVLVLDPDRNERSIWLLKATAGIVSGTFDGSDDCRDIPYCNPNITIEVELHQNRRDLARVLPGKSSAKNVEEIQPLLESVARFLGPLFKPSSDLP